MFSDPTLADDVPPIVARAGTFTDPPDEHCSQGQETTRGEKNNTRHSVLS